MNSAHTLALTLALSACSTPGTDITSDLALGAPADASVLGRTLLGDCAPAPLVLDPRWDEETAAHIRGAVAWWGFDLGGLPRADRDCTLDAAVAGCIAPRGYYRQTDPSPAGVDVHLPALIEYSASWGHLEHLVAHEVGHWIGVPHIDTQGSVMHAELPSTALTALTDADRTAHAEACEL